MIKGKRLEVKKALPKVEMDRANSQRGGNKEGGEDASGGVFFGNPDIGGDYGGPIAPFNDYKTVDGSNNNNNNRNVNGGSWFGGGELK